MENSLTIPAIFSASLCTSAHFIIGPEEQSICKGKKWAWVNTFPPLWVQNQVCFKLSTNSSKVHAQNITDRANS